MNLHTSGDNSIVGSIHIDWLVEGEGDVIPVERAVRAGVERGYRSLRQARDKLLDITNALRCRRRVSRPVDVPELEVCIKLGEHPRSTNSISIGTLRTNPVLEAFPLLFSEEITELREAQRDRLISA